MTSFQEPVLSGLSSEVSAPAFPTVHLVQGRMTKPYLNAHTKSVPCAQRSPFQKSLSAGSPLTPSPPKEEAGPLILEIRREASWSQAQ